MDIIKKNFGDILDYFEATKEDQKGNWLRNNLLKLDRIFLKAVKLHDNWDNEINVVYDTTLNQNAISSDLENEIYRICGIVYGGLYDFYRNIEKYMEVYYSFGCEYNSINENNNLSQQERQLLKKI